MFALTSIMVFCNKNNDGRIDTMTQAKEREMTGNRRQPKRHLWPKQRLIKRQQRMRHGKRRRTERRLWQRPKQQKTERQKSKSEIRV